MFKPISFFGDAVRWKEEYSDKIFFFKDGVKWEKKCSNQEPIIGNKEQIVDSLANRNGRIIGLFEARLYPVRTNNLGSFARDFFLPTIANHAIYVEEMSSTSKRVLKIIGALFQDIITFPIRLLTCMPRIVINHSKGENPLLTYLKQQDDDNARKLATMNRVYIDYLEFKRRRVQKYNFIDIPISGIVDRRNAVYVSMAGYKRSGPGRPFYPCYHVTRKALFEETAEWQKTLEGEEAAEVQKYLKQSNRRTIGVFEATLYPVRTNELKNFAKDFFLPTTLNHAVHLRNTAIRVMGIVLALGLDMITFPIRLVTCFPRATVNFVRNFTENPLIRYLRRQNDPIAEGLASLKRVRVSLLGCKTIEQTTYNFTEMPVDSSHFFGVHRAGSISERSRCKHKEQMQFGVSTE